MNYKNIIFFLALSSQFLLTAQLRIDTSVSPDNLIRKHLLKEGSDLIIKNVEYSGWSLSRAYFKNETELELINEGILLSTGSAFDAVGPNKKASTGIRTSARSDVDLQAVATGVVLDAAVLEFDLIALKDSIVFEYVFASDEYPEFVNKGVNDIFGFFLTEVGGRSIFPQNLAIIPSTNEVVSVNTVNHRVNREYFLPSDYLSAHVPAFWEKHPQVYLRAKFLEYDGFTTVLKATVKLKEGKTYHLKFAIADVGDRFYDSVVLLKANSFSSTGKRIASADSIVKVEVEENLRKFTNSYSELSDLGFSLKINFNTNEAVILEESYSELNSFANVLNEFRDLTTTIIGHTDNDGSESDNIELSKRRAIAVKKYLYNRGISHKRLSIKGEGEAKPISTNTTEQGKAENRRVEFQLAY